MIVEITIQIRNYMFCHIQRNVTDNCGLGVCGLGAMLFTFNFVSNKKNEAKWTPTRLSPVITIDGVSILCLYIALLCAATSIPTNTRDLEHTVLMRVGGHLNSSEEFEQFKFEFPTIVVRIVNRDVRSGPQSSALSVRLCRLFFLSFVTTNYTNVLC